LVKNKLIKDDYQKYQEERFKDATERKVPSTSLGRAYEISKVGASLFSSALGSKVKGAIGLGSGSLKKDVLNEKNAEKLSQTLCKMRGAALKLGQALSMQEDFLIPEQVKKAMEKARRSANIMPRSQLEKVIKSELGDRWEDKLKEFQWKPFAAASIGQVHKAQLLDGTWVAMKIQYPGVASSIDSDLNNLKFLLDYTGIFPKSMFLNEFISNTRVELKDECNYTLEAIKQERYRELSQSIPNIEVPEVIKELSTPRILTMRFIQGVDLDLCAEKLSQKHRNYLGRKIMEVTLREIFDWRFMQTDPNPANYFYNPIENKVYLLDFGAAREYSEEFVKNYMITVHGAATNNAANILEATTKLGFIVGNESKEMIDAHIESILIVGEPFVNKGLFDFGNQKMTERIYKLMPVMLKHRQKPPPPEVYSLHRKLSGAYLMNMKLKTEIPTRDIFFEIYNQCREKYQL